MIKQKEDVTMGILKSDSPYKYGRLPGGGTFRPDDGSDDNDTDRSSAPEPDYDEDELGM